MSDTPTQDRRVWIEESEIPGGQLVERVQELIRQPNVQRIIVRNIYDEVMVDIPLPVGVFFGGMMMVFAPGLVGLGGIGVLLSHVKVQVIREADVSEQDSYDHQIAEEDTRDTRAQDRSPEPQFRSSERQIDDRQGRTRIMNPFAQRATDDNNATTRVRIPRRRDESEEGRTRIAPTRRPGDEEQPYRSSRVSSSFADMAEYENDEDEEDDELPLTSAPGYDAVPRPIRIRSSVHQTPDDAADDDGDEDESEEGSPLPEEPRPIRIRPSVRRMEQSESDSEE